MRRHRRDERVHDLLGPQRDRWAPDDDRHRVALARGLGRHADAREQGALLVDVDRLAERPVHARWPERDAHGLGRRRVRVDDPDRDSPARPAADERGCPVGAHGREAVVLALLEAEARLAPERVAEGRPADADRVEDRRLDDDLVGRVRDLARGPAHDARDRERSALVGDEERIGREVAHDVVERLEALPGPCQADVDRAAADRRRIERVDRLAELEHDVVRGVHDVRDRSLARGDEATLHLPGRRADRHAVHVARDEPGAESRVLDVDADVRRRRIAGLDDREVGQRERSSGRRRDLAGEAEDRQGVAAVRLHVDVEHDVAGERSRGRGRSGYRLEDEDAVGIVGQAQLVTRAEHPLTRDAGDRRDLDAPVAGQHSSRQRHRDALARRDVRRATDDRELGLAIPDAHAGQARASTSRDAVPPPAARRRRRAPIPRRSARSR